MAYFVMFSVGVGEILSGDLYANVSRGRGFEECAGHVIDHNYLRAHFLACPHGGGLMDEEPQGFQGGSGREEAIHLPVVELFPNEPTSVHWVLIIPLIDINPSGLYDLPFASQGLVPGYLIIYPFISEVRDLLSCLLYTSDAADE